MKTAALKETLEVFHKIEAIEEDVSDLKLSLLMKLTPSKKNIISLKGILNGIQVSEEDIKDGQKSLYSKTGIIVSK